MPWVALIPKLVLTDEGGGNELAGPRRPDDPEIQQPRERFLSLRINNASMRERVQARRGCPGRQGRRKSKHASLLNAMQSPTVRDLSQSLRPFALTSTTYLGRVAKHPGPRGAPPYTVSCRRWGAWHATPPPCLCGHIVCPPSATSPVYSHIWSCRRRDIHAPSSRTPPSR